MFNCVRPPEQQQQQQEELQEQQNGQADAAAAAVPCLRRPKKLRVRLQLHELEGVTLSHGVLFTKVRLLHGGRFCQFSEHRELRDNKVSWADQAPMEFACRLGLGAAPAHLRVSVRREERGGRSSTKVGYAMLDLSDLPWVGYTVHKCILSPYSMGQRLDNSTLSLSLQPLMPQSALDAAAAATDVPQQSSAGTPPPTLPPPLPLALASAMSASTSSTALASLAGVGGVGGGVGGGHRRNASNFSACSMRTHSRTNSLEQDILITSNSSQSSSVPSFDLIMPSSLERRRTGLTPTRELSSRIANTRTDNFQIVKEVLEREGILLAPDTVDS